jgi:hypothetical protein
MKSDHIQNPGDICNPKSGDIRLPSVNGWDTYIASGVVVVDHDQANAALEYGWRICEAWCFCTLSQ